MKRLMLALAASLWLPTLCAALRAPAPAMRARAVAVQSPPAAQASDLAQNLASGEDAEKLSEPESWRWIDGSGKPMGTFSRVLEEIHRDSRDEVHVGCDSAVQSGGRVVFATVICVISRGGGGRYFYARKIEPHRFYPALQTRLLREVEFSLETAELLTSNDIDVETVHCDSNVDPSCKSTEHTRMLTGYIQSMGYEYLVKPHAWATFVADRHSRGLMRQTASEKRAWRKQYPAFAA